MKNLSTVPCLAFMLLLPVSFALADHKATHSTTATGAEPKHLTAQQELMKDCNSQATGMTGDSRKTFMSSCLKGETHAKAGLTTQQERMKSCNASANGEQLKGDARKKFMSECLKGTASPA